MSVIGVMTAGGDCPGLNAVIRAVVARAVERGASVVGVLNGWEGLMSDQTVPLDRNAVRGILKRGGTILGTSRMDPYVHGEGYESVRGTVERHRLDALVVAGGDGTLRTALRLHEDGLPVVGVPKTIDNDIPGTDYTFGFDTAMQIATNAIDRITTTAEAHNRVMLVEVMGRTCGWIATYAGIASGADAVLVPEIPYDLDAVARILYDRHGGGHRYSVIVVAEGVAPPPGQRQDLPRDAFGFERLGGVSYLIARRLEEITSFETRVTVLGHVQRGGRPTAFDRVLGTRYGSAAADLALEGRRGVMVACRGPAMVPIPLADVCGEPRCLDPGVYRLAATFFN